MNVELRGRGRYVSASPPGFGRLFRRFMMRIDPQSWPTLSGLLDQLLDLPEEFRTEWLEHLGPAYADLLPVLRQLIQTQESAGSSDFLNTLPRMRGAANPAFYGGALVGPYRLLSELGQGGMGVVWLAERSDGEMKRTVALKLPLISLHNRTLAERFTRERNILAQLAHPRIARLYDAGVAEGGQPYLALEYVEGERITTYCGQRTLDLNSRLQLFLQVLGAVQYAHSNLIVHRDLKPANILVTNGGDVRLLDFGIAKLLTEGEADETELTRDGGRALTYDYASPEQIAGGTITTASDVYSLGVILYELLTGARPYNPKRKTLSGLEDAILEAEPVQPSSAATGRSAHQLKGDLDTIVLKALNKQPSQRYTTADAFAQDLQRYLTGEPVLARPASRWYRARKFVVRNKLSVGSSVAVIGALSIGLGVALWEAHIAQVQTRNAETVRTFLLEIFRANSNAQPDPLKARQTTARDLLDIGANRISSGLSESPEAKLSVLETLFHLFVDLGLQERAASLGMERIALAKSVYGRTRPEVARALLDLATNSGESSIANQRSSLLKEAGDILDRNRDSRSRLRAQYYLALGNNIFRTDTIAAERFGKQSVELWKTFPPSRELVSALNLVGQAQDHLRKYPEAIANLSEAARVANTLQGEARGPLPAIYAYLGDAKRHAMDLSGAEQSLRQAVEFARGLKGEEHVDVIQTKYRLGIYLAQTSRPVEGLEFLKQAVDLAVRTQTPGEAFHTPMAREGYGLHLIRYGRVEDGLVQIAQSLETLRQAKASETPGFANTLGFNIIGETELGHYGQAEGMLAEASAIRSRFTTGPAEYRYEDAVALATFLTATGKADKAASVLESVPMGPEVVSQLSYPWLDMSIARAEADLARGRFAAAIERARETRTRIEGSGLANYFKRWMAQATLLEGEGLLRTKRTAEALPLLQSAVHLGTEVYDLALSPALADSQVALASCLLELGRPDQARPLLAQARSIHARHRDLGEHHKKPLREAELLQRQRK